MRGLRAASDEDCAGQDCSLTVFVGFTGSDRNGVALQTGSQINRLNQYSVSSLYNSVVSQVWQCTSAMNMHASPNAWRLRSSLYNQWASACTWRCRSVGFKHV